MLLIELKCTCMCSIWSCLRFHTHSGSVLPSFVFLYCVLGVGRITDTPVLEFQFPTRCSNISNKHVMNYNGSAFAVTRHSLLFCVIIDSRPVSTLLTSIYVDRTLWTIDSVTVPPTSITIDHHRPIVHNASLRSMDRVRGAIVFSPSDRHQEISQATRRI